MGRLRASRKTWKQSLLHSIQCRAQSRTRKKFDLQRRTPFWNISEAVESLHSPRVVQNFMVFKGCSFCYTPQVLCKIVGAFRGCRVATLPPSTGLNSATTPDPGLRSTATATATASAPSCHSFSSSLFQSKMDWTQRGPSICHKKDTTSKRHCRHCKTSHCR